jgi:hypothetical protein
VGQKIGGGVITDTVNSRQEVAATTGLTGVAWPTDVMTGKIAVLGLDSSSAPAASKNAFDQRSAFGRSRW